MKPICSCVIPSRGRPDGLHKAIQSIRTTAYDPSRIEIMVGLDDDDKISLRRLKEFEAIPGVKVFVWPRDVIAMFATLCRMSDGEWLIMFNDDATIKCDDVKWDLQLAQFPTTGVVLQPEIYQLNESRYSFATRTGFPWFPNKCWETFRCGDFIPHPADYAVCDIAEKHNWKIDFLKGVTVVHDRKNERVNATSRKLGKRS